MGFGHPSMVKMSQQTPELDLQLWLDQETIPRQNHLKKQFWELLSRCANAIPSENLLSIHPKSNGPKLTRGNDLLGFPYQVLDLIRDFDPEFGLNIRVLNWFGHGLYLFILIGKKHVIASERDFQNHKFYFCTAKSAWDYPEIILDEKYNPAPSQEEITNARLIQWFKPIQITDEIPSVEQKISLALKDTLIFIRRCVG